MNRFLPRRLLPGIVMFGISTLLLLAPASFAEDVWIDVRSPQEFSSAHVDGAINIEFDSIVTGIDAAGVNKDDAIYLYCGSGHRASIARKALVGQGYTQVRNLGGLADALSHRAQLRSESD